MVGTLEPNAAFTGDAVTADVLTGKTFSNGTDIGLTGTLKVREGGTIYTNSIGMEFFLLPAGTFVMGSPEGTGDAGHRPIWPGETGRSSSELQHIVSLSTPLLHADHRGNSGTVDRDNGQQPLPF